MTDSRATTRKLKAILDGFVRAAKMSSDEAEREMNLAANEVRALPREGILAALDAAVGRSKIRKKAAINVLSELIDVPGVVDRLSGELKNPDWRVRHWVLDTIGFHNLVQLAPLLNKVILEDPDNFCRSGAINLAGAFRQDVNFPVILSVVGERGLESALVHALTDYGREEGRPFLRLVFERPVGERPAPAEFEDTNNPEALRKCGEWSDRKCAKLWAAWGLAKLGDVEAIQHLGEMLYDPEYRGRLSCYWGESRRAAQAIADVFGLPFEWSPEGADHIRKWWQENKERVIRNL
jgi:hypothetical protein